MDCVPVIIVINIIINEIEGIKANKPCVINFRWERRGKGCCILRRCPEGP